MRGIGFYHCQAFVDELMVAESDMMLSAQDKDI
jgi:hypothetical protein